MKKLLVLVVLLLSVSSCSTQRSLSTDVAYQKTCVHDACNLTSIHSHMW